MVIKQHLRSSLSDKSMSSSLTREKPPSESTDQFTFSNILRLWTTTVSVAGSWFHCCSLETLFAPARGRWNWRARKVIISACFVNSCPWSRTCVCLIHIRSAIIPGDNPLLDPAEFALIRTKMDEKTGVVSLLDLETGRMCAFDTLWTNNHSHFATSIEGEKKPSLTCLTEIEYLPISSAQCLSL